MGFANFWYLSNLSLSGQIAKNRKGGKIYVADFGTSSGRYISSGFDSNNPVDMELNISPKVVVRLTYIFNGDKINGLQIIKTGTGNTKQQEITLSSFDGKSVLALLSMFSRVDLKSIANESIILDKNIIKDPNELVKFLNTVATDPQGKEKLREVSQNLGLLTPTFLNEIVRRKKNTEIMDKMLNNGDYFQQVKTEMKVGKDEEVWQKFFEKNDWILGSDIVEILDNRVFDEHNKVDMPVKSLDGFLDIIELKLPTAKFWNKNDTPNSALTEATMQCAEYLQVAERIADVKHKIEELGCNILKPRITLLYGRSNEWDEKQREQFRLLNSLYHNINILTYDLVLNRAKRIIDFADREQ